MESRLMMIVSDGVVECEVDKVQGPLHELRVSENDGHGEDIARSWDVDSVCSKANNRFRTTNI